mmetsp:Transcript_57337/g.123298  ORF Transcript_57337/g.123298 Transcript_57337/m.123298 type:complete len:200 (-) Transcript_57337:1196-1795(-)
MSSALRSGLPHARHCKSNSSVELVLLVSDIGSSWSSAKRKPPVASCTSLLGCHDSSTCKYLCGGSICMPASDASGTGNNGSSSRSAPASGCATGGSNRPPPPLPSPAAAVAAARAPSTMPAAALAVMASTMASASAAESPPVGPGEEPTTHSRRTANTRALAPRSASARPGATRAGKSWRSIPTRSGLVAPAGATFPAT